MEGRMSKNSLGRGSVLQSTVEVPMVDPEDVRAMKELRRLGWGSRSIARELGVARATVRRYVRGDAQPGVQERPGARRLDGTARAAAVELLDGAAAGNAVVVAELLGEQGVAASVRTGQRAAAQHPEASRAPRAATA